MTQSWAEPKQEPSIQHVHHWRLRAMLLHLLLALQSGLPVLQALTKECGGLQEVYVCHPQNPAHFDICVGRYKYTFYCPDGLHFNSVTQVCDWPRNADCGHSHLPSLDFPPRARAHRAWTNPFATSVAHTRPDRRHASAVHSTDNGRVDSDSNLTPRPVSARRGYVGREGENSRGFVRRGENSVYSPVPTQNGHVNEESNTFAKSRKNVQNTKNTMSQTGNNLTGTAHSLLREGIHNLETGERTVRRKTLFRRNPYLHSSAENQKHQEEWQNQNGQNSSQRLRKVQDGYRHFRNFAGQKSKSPNTKQQGLINQNNNFLSESINWQRMGHNQKINQRTDVRIKQNTSKHVDTDSRENTLKSGNVFVHANQDRNIYKLNGIGRVATSKDSHKTRIPKAQDLPDDHSAHSVSGTESNTQRSFRGHVYPWWTSHTPSPASRASHVFSPSPTPFQPPSQTDMAPSRPLSFDFRDPDPSSSSPRRAGLAVPTDQNPDPKINGDSQGLGSSAISDLDDHTSSRQTTVDDSNGPRHPRPSNRNSYRLSVSRHQGDSRRFSLYDHSEYGRFDGYNIPSRPGPGLIGRNRPQGPDSVRPGGAQGSKSAISLDLQGLRQHLNPAAKSVSAAAAAAAAAPAASPRYVLHRQQGSGTRSLPSAARTGRQNSKKRGKCSPLTCQLPNCRCVGTDIPGGLPSESTPQMIMLTFDDSVNAGNYKYYQRIFDGRFRNPNGCPAKGTFYVSGDATTYSQVDKLHKQGHEIASHSVTHRSPSTFWAHAGYERYVDEIEGMRERLSDKSKIPQQDIRGMRAPFLQLGGDAQYQMLQDFGFVYDSSMVTGHLYRNDKPPVWPFTLDYTPESKICSLPPCPTRSYPGLWEVPLVRWYGSNRVACAMPDGCKTAPGQEGTLRFLTDNFLRHYRTNRSPLGIFLHASWFQRKAGNLEALLDFLGRVTQKKDVWVVTVSQVIDWVQSPVANEVAGSIPSWSC